MNARMYLFYLKERCIPEPHPPPNYCHRDGENYYEFIVKLKN